MELSPLPLVNNPQVTLWIGRHCPLRRPRCTFLRLIKHILFVILAFCFLQKVAKIWNFWKVAINFCDSVNPLWGSSRVSRSKYNKTLCRGAVAAIVLSDSVAYLTGYVASTATPKKKKKKCWHRNGCPRRASTARNFLWRNYVGDFRWSSLLCMCSTGNIQRTKEFRHV